MKILLMGGSLRSGNLGVNALTRGTIELLASQFKELDITVLKVSNMKSETVYIETEGNRIAVKDEVIRGKNLLLLTLLVFINKYFLGSLGMRFLRHNQIINVMKQADYVLDLSEGDSFSDIYGIKRFLIHSVNKYLVLLLKKPLVILPQTIGPFKRGYIKRIAAYLLSRSKHAYVRDEVSFRVSCDVLGIDHNQVTLVPDMAFFMKPHLTTDFNKQLNKIKASKELLVGFNVSGLLWNGGYTKNNMFGLNLDYKTLVRNAVAMILNENRNAAVLFIPHVITSGKEWVEDDLTVCRQLQKELKKKYPGKVYCLEKAYKENEIKAIIGQCDFFIGSRMHSCIGAIAMRIPTVPIAYSRKFIGVWKMFSLDGWVADPRKQSSEEILQVIRSGIQTRQKIKEQTEENMFNVTYKIRTIAESLAVD
ncbi:hypothetical protein P22_0538 [Propionispora sp. 2/2-37]|uniref:polysaccharide pyruvyl transferase family protein n=1 Tax=Propionispora sp. 2/2-37 TaxID=1677858 RepID=UPI0006BB9843|nr:polysaccharide pyruvyl transferase family protein [Propionispora sp. 2/2-37]CUH94472.1 hypothetical protein P22_0538 [Propionispora sp. 2/2-37]